MFWFAVSLREPPSAFESCVRYQSTSPSSCVISSLCFGDVVPPWSRSIFFIFSATSPDSPLSPSVR